ncbi:MAG: isoleucine--tRNA ligase [Bacteroidales bacterium]|nr:isoleucine--tRNA ligase [Bacteroidales bacterium]
MGKKYREYRSLDLTLSAKETNDFWVSENIFEKSLEQRINHKPFVFYEGPPSANGTPGIHHVMARAIKDIFCRYKTLKGYYVSRKAGWDTHGLPVEIGVEKKLGITKEDIGSKISVEDYNLECRTEVMKYKDLWDELTIQMGYWVDLSDPYITFDNRYIESVWNLLSVLYEKGLIYKGYTIQPFSPAAGTGLSTHELNQPGCYRMVKDNSLVTQFKIIQNKNSEKLFDNQEIPVYFLAWTTTPWTLPSNTGLAVGPKISYSLIETLNPYTGTLQKVVLATELIGRYFDEKNQNIDFATWEVGKKELPWKNLATFKGKELLEIRYEQLLPYAQPSEGDPFRIVSGDFVTTEDGTGVVHIAPSFGADDFKIGKQYNLGSLTLVDRTGKFTPEMGEFAGRFVKTDFDPEFAGGKVENVDISIITKLKKENLAFKSEKYEHSYPHCWRTDKPILYYPLDSWFIKTTAYKDRLLELNKTIQWKPESTGTGRFGNWLENLVDWNLSRSRYWGTPLPIWRTSDGSEEICIGSVEQLRAEVSKAVSAGIMSSNPLESYTNGDNSADNYQSFDLHKPFVDKIILVSSTGQPMQREADLIDVWFDSGAMPYAQFHYPFERKNDLDQIFPADFIAEGVDQTRGWFFTLHAIATMVFDSVAFKNVVSNGLVLDKSGNKMSKRLGNAIDPFETIAKYGADATRWYMITNAQPWDNLKFDINGIAEVQRKFFGTLHNVYSFFVLYANIDGFDFSEAEIPLEQRPELDRWILSELHSLIKNTDTAYNEYEPTKAGRFIAHFVDEHLSNWYVRLSRRRFWKGDYSQDKISAYQTLYTCLTTITQLASPIAPFYTDTLFRSLNEVTSKSDSTSVHLTDFPIFSEAIIDSGLEERMELAQKISSMVLSLRKRSNLRVRQPLNKILIPTDNEHLKNQILNVQHIIISEVNIKELEFISEEKSNLVKSIKPDFKKLGPRFGKQMKTLADRILAFTQDEIRQLEEYQEYSFDMGEISVRISADDCEIITEDIPGWVVSNSGNLTVALDVHLTESLIEEGHSRDLVNKIQNLRKDSEYEVTDKILIKILHHTFLDSAIINNYAYICSETLAEKLDLVDDTNISDFNEIAINDQITTKILITKA